MLSIPKGKATNKKVSEFLKDFICAFQSPKGRLLTVDFAVVEPAKLMFQSPKGRLLTIFNPAELYKLQ